MNRRQFLALGAVLGVSFTAVVVTALPVIPARPMPDADAALSWISFKDGRYLLSLPRAEIGQNIMTALKQVACDELGVDWHAVDVSLADTASIAPFRATVGSESVQDFAVPLAQACATLRDALKAGKSGALEAEPRPYATLRAFRSGGEGTVVGRPVRLEQAHEIVTGAPLFAADTRLDGMVYGRVLRAPASPELRSRPLGWDETAARRVAGFVALVDDRNLDLSNSRGLGIVAETPGALDRIETALAVAWSAPHDLGQEAIDSTLDIDARMARGGAEYDVADEPMSETADWDVDLRFDIPFAAHAAIEPRAAVADVAARQARVWAGSQDPFFVRDAIADRLGLAERNVVVVPCRVGGGFGGKVVPTVELEAAVLSQASGRPVKVQWTRAQEFAYAYHRSQTSHRVSARVRDGRVTDWRHRMASGHVIFTNAGLPAWMQRLTDFIGDFGTARGLEPPYRLANRRIGYDLERLPVLTGAWRGLGAGPNGFAIESAMDECARATGADPVAFRRDHIEDPRLLGVLDAVAVAAGARSAAGRGVACGIYKEKSYVAIIADVALDDDGRPRVVAIWCAHDCGKIINPDQVRAQCEGNIVWGLGMALSDALTVESGVVSARDFIDAPVPTIDQDPEMHVRLIETDAPPAGAGETAIVATAAAVANGVRDLTGIRPRHLPIRAEHLAG